MYCFHKTAAAAGSGQRSYTITEVNQNYQGQFRNINIQEIIDYECSGKPQDNEICLRLFSTRKKIRSRLFLFVLLSYPKSTHRDDKRRNLDNGNSRCNVDYFLSYKLPTKIFGREQNLKMKVPKKKQKKHTRR